MILDGKTLQEKRKKLLKLKVSKLKKKPVLVIIQIGSNKASDLYIKRKIDFGKEVGVGVEYYQLKNNVTFDFLRKIIRDFNNDGEIRGIIIQLPIPNTLDKRRALNLIDPKKDVDGLRKSKYIGATPKAILTILKENKVKIKDSHVVVVGDSELVGKPTAKCMREKGAKVKICNISTKDLKRETLKADILISAVGKPKLIKKDMVKDGVVVIDVGTNFVKGKLKGDVDFDGVSKIASKITPVPGGVGPMTVASLFENLIG